MSGMQGISGTGSMSKSCSMKAMHESSKVKTQDEMQVETRKQSDINRQDRIPNQIVGNKIDAKI